MTEPGEATRPSVTAAGGEQASLPVAPVDTEARLKAQLQHFRSWLGLVHSKAQHLSPQAVKNSRRVYVGNVPPETTEDELRQFIEGLMASSGALVSAGNAVLGCRITPGKGYGFVEMRSVEETSNAMAFDGAAFKGVYLKIRRPSNYDPAAALMLGPMLPDPTLDLSSITICRTVVEDSPDKLFIGGLPCDWGENQVKDLLTPYGVLRSFNLVMDKVTGMSKGYAFCEFMEESAVEAAIKGLNQSSAGSKVLTVKRALDSDGTSGGGTSIAGANGGGGAKRGSGGGAGRGLPLPMMHPAMYPPPGTYLLPSSPPGYMTAPQAHMAGYLPHGAGMYAYAPKQPPPPPGAGGRSMHAGGHPQVRQGGGNWPAGPPR